ncbi:Rha family transcriptional regulator [Desulfovibrio litoralis]|uniref:Phage regulatory protein, rha family n=1 Tax=Desulfovibrio litoralis DSM 11393 TaxID=1121455 RepID=A0A1M7T8C2_9BACT|nr:Rha family transcriptional regulator [Desulfovibrio litoralis]SHN66943.1 phage regulatory protein, rha family [Desulfovibrio litoralis DSM 11393]
MTNLVETVNGKVVVSSLKVAEHFEKQHAHVLRALKNITNDCEELFNRSNFGLVEYIDEKGESRPCYHLTRDAFTLLAMGFTGKKALAWKIKYIEAFNKMEQALLNHPTTIADRRPLDKLVKVWAVLLGGDGGVYPRLWTQVNSHLNITNIDKASPKQIKKAISFVQARIDELQSNSIAPAKEQPQKQLELAPVVKALPPRILEVETEIKYLEQRFRTLYTNITIKLSPDSVSSKDFARKKEMLVIGEHSTNAILSGISSIINQLNITKRVYMSLKD